MDEVYFVRADHCVRFDIDANLVDGAAGAIAVVWPGLARLGFGDGFDAAVNYGNEKAYFFKADSYVRVDIRSGAVESESTGSIIDNWAGLERAGFGAGIDAAVNYGDGHVYFFKGDKYVAYSIGEEKVVGGVGLLTDWALPEGFETGLDAAVHRGDDGKVYFFKGTQYACYDIASTRGEYSAAIVDYWPGVDAAGFADGLRGSWCTADPRTVPIGPPAPTLDPVHWEQLEQRQRFRYAMERLVDHYGYPVNGAAGLVGNLFAESGLIPSRIESSKESTPLRSEDFHEKIADFSPEQVMNRDKTTGSGPKKPGIGLAQWTSDVRRNGLFAHAFDGVVLRARILFDMDAQLDYVVYELRNRPPFAEVERRLKVPTVTREEASDEVLIRFESPGAVSENGMALPRSDPRVQEVCRERRPFAERAHEAYQAGR